MTAIDPVCKMKIEEKDAKYQVSYKGKTYYFCTPRCKLAFERYPHRFIQSE